MQANSFNLDHPAMCGNAIPFFPLPMTDHDLTDQLEATMATANANPSPPSVDWANNYFRAENETVRRKAIEISNFDIGQQSMINSVFLLKTFLLVQELNHRVLKLEGSSSSSINETTITIIKSEVESIFRDPTQLYSPNFDNIMDILIKSRGTGIKDPYNKVVIKDLRKQICSISSNQSIILKRLIQYHINKATPLEVFAKLLFPNYTGNENYAIERAALLRFFEQKNDSEQAELMGRAAEESNNEDDSGTSRKRKRKERSVLTNSEVENLLGRRANIRMTFVERFKLFFIHTISSKSEEDQRHFINQVLMKDEAQFPTFGKGKKSSSPTLVESSRNSFESTSANNDPFLGGVALN